MTLTSMFNSSYQEDEKALRLEMQVSLKSKSEKDSREVCLRTMSSVSQSGTVTGQASTCMSIFIRSARRILVFIHTDRELTNEKDNELESQFAQTLRQEIMQEFPELPMFKMHRTPIGPHTLGMFEVDIFTPAQLGALVGWLAIHHGSLSILVHPHTGDEFKDHTQNAIWIGESVPLNLDFLRKSKDMDEVAKRMQQLTAN